MFLSRGTVERRSSAQRRGYLTATQRNPAETAASAGRPETLAAEDDFWSRVDKTGGPLHPILGRCWPWRSNLRTKGYGSFPYEGRSRPAHRLAYVFSRGPISDGLLVRHLCDNPPCCNPVHLALGTTADNMADMVRSGRQHRGALSGKSRLSERDVSEIRRLRYAGSSELAELFGVSVSAIDSILGGKTWRHVPFVEPLTPRLTPGLAKIVNDSHERSARLIRHYRSNDWIQRRAGELAGASAVSEVSP